MGVSIDGVVSGIDTTSLISAIIASYAAPKEKYEDQIETLEDTKTGLTKIIGLMGDMEDALEDIEEVQDFLSYTASYEENDSVAVDVDGDAVAGTYAIAVTQLAKAEQEVSQAFSSKTSSGLLATGTFTVSYGSATSTITISSSSSLADVANDLDDIDGISAYVMNTGDATNPYKLVIQGEDTGEDYAITFDTSGLTGTGTVLSFTEKVSAQNAALTVNGISISHSDNSVDTAIPGMTITLTDTTTSAINVTVASDPDAIIEKVQAFVDAYNAVYDYYSAQTSYDAEEDIRGKFVGESSVSRAMFGLQTVISSAFDSLGIDYDSLGLVGIGSDGTGTLSIDSDEFEDALEAAPDQVTEFFTGSGGFIETMLAKLDVYIDSYDGTLENRADSIDDRIESLEDQVDRYEKRIDKYEARLRKKFNAMESILGALNGSSAYIATLFTQKTS